MDAAYQLQPQPPTAADYARLRRESGLSPVRPDQAERSVAGGWYGVHVVHLPTGETVGMGRVLGDDGWYFHIVDMAVLPAHQRRGIGDAVLAHLVAHIRATAPDDPWITLLADPPGRRLYERHGFRDTAPGSVGMALPRSGSA